MDEKAIIAIVDDEPINFDVMEVMLVQEEYKLEFIASGFELFDYLERQQPDVILLDVMMPKLDGLEVCRRLKENYNWRHIPIIMVTALNDKEDLASCLNTGADDFISKPVNSLELQARVNSMLRIKQQYDAMQELIRIKDVSLQLREDLSNTIVHDLRNPLTGILFATNLLQRMRLTKKQRKKVNQIQHFGQQLHSLVDDVLMLAKLDSGKFLLHLTRFDPCIICRLALEDWQEIGEQQNIELIGEFPEIRPTLMMDVTLLRRVIDNLLSNAIKFSPAGSKVTLRIEYPSETKLRIQVEDMGRGINEKLRQRLFEKFETGDVVEGVKQTGLGLAFCKLAVEAHDGTISVDAASPRGSIFTIEIPDRLPE